MPPIEINVSFLGSNSALNVMKVMCKHNALSLDFSFDITTLLLMDQHLMKSQWLYCSS